MNYCIFQNSFSCQFNKFGICTTDAIQNHILMLVSIWLQWNGYIICFKIKDLNYLFILTSTLKSKWSQLSFTTAYHYATSNVSILKSKTLWQRSWGKMLAVQSNMYQSIVVFSDQCMLHAIKLHSVSIFRVRFSPCLEALESDSISIEIRWVMVELPTASFDIVTLDYDKNSEPSTYSE